MADPRFVAYKAYKNGSMFSHGSTPVPEEVANEAHEIRWLGPDDIDPVE